MTTLIILTILFAIAIITLIIISIKKFNDKLHYILIELDLLDDKITDIDDENKKIANNLNEKITSILNKVNKIDSRFITLHETIKDNLNNIEVAIKSLVNSINAIEENNDNIIKSLGEINKFNNNHRRCTEAINNKVIDIKNEQGILKQTISNIEAGNSSRHANVLNTIKEIKNIVVDVNDTTPRSEDIIDSDELVNRIAEGIYNKLIDLQAKNSLLANKVEKPSPAKSKHRTRAKKADNSYNSVQDAPQQNISEN